MAQKRFEERLEANDKEIEDIKMSLQKLPLMDETLTSLAKNIERLTIQAEKQQQVSNEMQKFLASFVSGHCPWDFTILDRFSVDLKITEATEETPIVLPHTGSNEGGGDRKKFKKVDMSVFGGTDPNSWLFCAHHYFTIHRLSEEEKMTMAVISFKFAALDWYHAIEE